MADLSMIDLIYVSSVLQNVSIRVKHTANTRGGNHEGSCPECGDGNGLYILPNAIEQSTGKVKGKWACRSCHPREGDAVEMLVYYDKLSPSQAFNRLRELYPDLPDERKYKNAHQKKPTPILIKPLAGNAVPPSQEWQTRARKVLTESQVWLWSDVGKDALQYLLSRGLTEETIKAAGYGYLYIESGHDAVREKPRMWGLEIDTFKDGIYLPSGIVIPYFYKDDLWKLRIRRIGENIPKDKRYSIVSGSSNGLYNADAIRPGKPVLIQEGEIDALSVQQVMGSDIACVATGGTTQGRIPLWRSRLALTSIALVSFDNDEKSESTADAIKYWTTRIDKAKIHPIPTAYKDANKMLCDGGDIKHWVLSGLGEVSPAAPTLTSEAPGVPTPEPVNAGQQVTTHDTTPCKGEEQEQHTPYVLPSVPVEYVTRPENMTPLGVSHIRYFEHVDLKRENMRIRELTRDEVIWITHRLCKEGIFDLSQRRLHCINEACIADSGYPFLTYDQVSHFYYRYHELVASFLIHQYKALAMTPHQRAEVFYREFCAHPAHDLRVRDDGKLAIGVPDSFSDAQFELIAHQACSYGEALLQVIQGIPPTREPVQKKAPAQHLPRVDVEHTSIERDIAEGVQQLQVMGVKFVLIDEQVCTDCVQAGITLTDEQYEFIHSNAESIKRLFSEVTPEPVQTVHAHTPIVTCGMCDQVATHYSPSGHPHCAEHYLCRAGHVPDWVQHNGHWYCRCAVERMPTSSPLQGNNVIEQVKSLLTGETRIEHTPVQKPIQTPVTPAATRSLEPTPVEQAIIQRRKPDNLVTGETCTRCWCRLRKHGLKNGECAKCNASNFYSNETMRLLDVSCRENRAAMLEEQRQLVHA